MEVDSSPSSMENDQDPSSTPPQNQHSNLTSTSTTLTPTVVTTPSSPVDKNEAEQQTPRSPSPTQLSPVAGPRCAPTYSVVNAILDKKEDGPGPRCGHTLTAVPAVGGKGVRGVLALG